MSMHNPYVVRTDSNGYVIQTTNQRAAKTGNTNRKMVGGKSQANGASKKLARFVASNGRADSRLDRPTVAKVTHRSTTMVATDGSVALDSGQGTGSLGRRAMVARIMAS